MSVLDKLSEMRKNAYTEYLGVAYKMREERNMFSDEKETIVKNAYNKYKEIEKRIDEIELFTEQEELESSRPISVQI